MPMDTMKLRASLKALDDLQEMLDTRDAMDAKKMKEDHIAANKGSDADTDESGPGDKTASENGKDATGDTQDASDQGQSDEGDEASRSDKGQPEDSSDSFMDDLKRMSENNPSASSALKLLMDEDDEEDKPYRGR